MAMPSVKSDPGTVDNWQSGKTLAECNLHMLTSEDSCDVSFRVGKNEMIVRAHRYVLISRSCVFRVMFCGPLVEKNDITIPDAEADIFTELLRFLYTNESEPTPVNVTSLLYLAKKYAVGGLEHLCLTYLKTSLSAENACVILEQAHVFDEKELFDTALKYILINGENCLGTDDFSHLCRGCFDKVISSDLLDVDAEQLFMAAISWTKNECKREGREITPANQRSVPGEILYAIPFPDMEKKYYVDKVLQCNILTSDENHKIMAHIMDPESDPSPFRKRTHNVEAVTHSLSMTVATSSDVIFYRRHKKVRHAVKNGSGRATGGFELMCSHDVRLLGVYVYGSATGYDRYSLEVYQYGPIYYEHQYKYNQHHIKEITLREPLNIEKGVGYNVIVSMNGGESPVFEGDGFLTQVTVGQCSFTINDTGTCSLVHGLIFKI